MVVLVVVLVVAVVVICISPLQLLMLFTSNTPLSHTRSTSLSPMFVVPVTRGVVILGVRGVVIVGAGALLMSQLSLDSALLEQCNVMDYSLLLGVRRNIHRKEAHTANTGGARGGSGGTLSGGVRESGSGWMGLVKHLLRSRGTEKNRRRSRYHNQDQGGVYSAPEDSIYYLGIIDILQKWNTRKKAECSIKRVREHVFYGPCPFLANVVNGLRCTHSLWFFVRCWLFAWFFVLLVASLVSKTGAAFFNGG